MKKILALLIVFFALPAFAQTAQTRANLILENNYDIYANGRGAITGPILNSLNTSFINSAAMLGDANNFTINPQFSACVGYPYSIGSAPLVCATTIPGTALANGAANYNLTSAEVWLPNNSISCNGSDETAAWNALFTTYPNGLRVHLPGKTCVYSTLTWPANYHVEGANVTQSVLSTNSGSADANIMGAADTFENVTFSSTVTRTAGNMFVEAGNGDIVRHFICANYFVCGTVGTVSTVAAGDIIEDGQLFYPVVGVGSGAIVALNFSTVSIKSITASGPSSGQQPDFGLKFVNGDTGFITGNNITLHGAALEIAPTSGLNVYSLQFGQNDFDSAGLVSGSANAQSCLIGGAGNVYETTMDGVWCGLAKNGQDGMLVQPTGSGTVDGLHISNPLFEGNGGAGFHISAASVTNWDIKGGSASGNTGAAVYITGATTHGSISGLKGNTNGVRGPNNYGLDINAAADYLTITDNDFSGNTFGNYVNTGVIGGHNKITFNSGYNPVGVTGPNTVGSSPATICAQFTNETHYYSQSATNTATVKLGSSSGQLVGTMSSASTIVTTNLGPGECEVVTWTTTAPTYSASLH